MKAFRTILSTPDYPFTVDLKTSVLSIGSCFAEHMGTRLKHNKAHILQNPFGILYNPLSIARCLESGLSPSNDFSEVLVAYDGLWHSFDHHGSFSTSEEKEFLHTINASHVRLYQFLKSTQLLICTFGTSHVYYHKESGIPVANCHKIPAKAFDRKMLMADEIVDKYSDLFARLSNQNPSMQILLSVSPVRHLKDGIISNQFSKAQLITACHILCQRFDFCHYFPAYEWIMDDLRDYRFYAQDMIHPTSLAIDYIWKHFMTGLFTEGYIQFIDELEKIHTSLAHRPLFSQSPGYRKFLKELKVKIERLSGKYSDVSFKEEIERWHHLG